MSGDRACEVVRAGAKLLEEELLSEDRLSASLEVCACVNWSTMIFFVSSVLTLVGRVSNMTSVELLPVPVLTVLVPCPVGLPLVIMSMVRLEVIIFERDVVSAVEEVVRVPKVPDAGKEVGVPSVSDAEKMVWVPSSSDVREVDRKSLISVAREVVGVPLAATAVDCSLCCRSGQCPQGLSSRKNSHVLQGL
jgi:hypothetical protein